MRVDGARDGTIMLRAIARRVGSGSRASCSRGGSTASRMRAVGDRDVMCFDFERQPWGKGLARAHAASIASRERVRAHARGHAGLARASEVTAREMDAREGGFDVDFWWTQVQNFNASAKPSTRGMIKRLDRNDPLGVDLGLRGASTRGVVREGSTKRLTLYDYALLVKRAHPRKVSLIRVGEFYECLGYDAVMLVMYAGLNPMGISGVPKAGCPAVKIQETLDRLTSRGFSCVVCEEAPTMNKYGQPPPPKDRYIAAIVTPASPNYVKGAASMGEDVDFGDGGAPPVIGLASSALGYTVVQIEPDLRRVSVLEGLTAEAAAAKLSSGGIAPPLYRHESLGSGHAQSGRNAAGTSAPSRRLRWEVQSILSAAEGVDAVKYSGDVVDKLLDLVRLDHGISPNQMFTRVNVENNGRPAPLSLSTAQQLGILPTRSVPPLLTHLLPERSVPAACRSYLQELLLHPPPPETAMSIQEACTLFMKTTSAMPQLEVLPPSKVAKLLSQREASHTFFADLASMARGVSALLTHQDENIRRAGDLMIDPTSLKLGSKLTGDILAKSCIEATSMIEAVISDDVLNGALILRDKIDDRDDDDGDSDDRDDSAFIMEGTDQPLKLENIPNRFTFENERWRGRVRQEHISEALEKVEKTARKLEKVVKEDLIPVIEEVSAERKGKAKKCELEYDMRNNSLWVRHIPKSVKRCDSLIHPRDRFGKEVADRWSTERVEDALDDYRVATQRAAKAVSDTLANLAEDLQEHISSLVGAATLSTVTTAILAHASNAINKRWSCPTLLPEGDTASPLSVEGLVPFWMRMDGAETVPNTFDLEGLVLLTGPNMAGKSTVLRSVAALALLAQCGLHVPAISAQVPRLDSLIVRMASTDSPVEGLSSFAVEMLEIKSMLSSCSARSLIMVDELGRGTEASHGTAIGGAVVEALDECGARGIFATHLHGILDLPLRVSPYTQRARMETAHTEDGILRPTWRMIPGECRESLALQTALDCGIPRSVVARANVLLMEEAKLPLIGSSIVASTTSGLTNEDTNARNGGDVNALKSILADAATKAFQMDDVDVISVGPNEMPPLSSAGQTCVYILRRGDGWCYCGESDHLPTRLTSHRQSTVRLIELVYVAVPKEAGGKSAARSLESRVIQALNLARVPLWSDQDASHKNFGAASSSG